MFLDTTTTTAKDRHLATELFDVTLITIDLIQ